MNKTSTVRLPLQLLAVKLNEEVLLMFTNTSRIYVRK